MFYQNLECMTRESHLIVLDALVFSNMSSQLEDVATDLHANLPVHLVEVE